MTTTNKTAIDALSHLRKAIDWYMQLPDDTHLNTLREALASPAIAALAPTVQDAERAATQPAGEVGYDEATNLAKALYSQHYRNDAKEWRVLPDIRGVLSQISNMVAGMTRHGATPTPQAAPTVQGSVDERAAFEQWKADFRNSGDGGYSEFDVWQARAALAQRAAVAEDDEQEEARRETWKNGYSVGFEAAKGLFTAPTASTPPAPASQIQWEANNPRAESGAAASPLMQVAPSVLDFLHHCAGAAGHDVDGTRLAQMARSALKSIAAPVPPAVAPEQSVPEFPLMDGKPGQIRVTDGVSVTWQDPPAATSGGEAVAITAEALLRSVYARPDLTEHSREQFFAEFMKGSDELSLCWDDFLMMAAVARRVALAPQPLPAASDASVLSDAQIEKYRIIAKTALSARNTALNDAAALAVRWGDARTDDGGGNALRNCAKAIRALISKDQ